MTNVDCNGNATGKITVNVNGGTTPYDFAWDGPVANDGLAFDQTAPYMIANLPAGTYDITVTDANGCTKVLNTMVAQPPALTANINPKTDVSCKGGANGTAMANGVGGMAPYSYLWSNGSTDKTATGLAAGVYTVTITDMMKCLEAARRIGVPPQYCRAYEDTDLGMQAIRAAGMEAVDVRELLRH